MPESQLHLLTRVVGRKSHPRNSTIIAAGDPTDALYIVISGRLKVMMSDDEGREVILAILNQGEFFGEMGLIDEAPRSATVIAIEPCELLTINKLDFKKCLQENFDICAARDEGAGEAPARGRQEDRQPRADGRVRARRAPADGDGRDSSTVSGW